MTYILKEFLVIRKEDHPFENGEQLECVQSLAFLCRLRALVGAK